MFNKNTIHKEVQGVHQEGSGIYTEICGKCWQGHPESTYSCCSNENTHQVLGTVKNDNKKVSALPEMASTCSPRHSVVKVNI
jgi:hypothetical protein